MPLELTDDQWDFIDELLFIDRQLPAIQFVRSSLDCRLNDAVKAVDGRKQKLGIDFSGSALARVDAFTRLNKITEPICVIEGSWDGDDGGWFVRLEAIVKRPSPHHAVYTQFGLCDISGIDAQVERAIALGEELAQAAHTTFYLTSADKYHVDYETRWWDSH